MRISYRNDPNTGGMRETLQLLGREFIGASGEPGVPIHKPFVMRVIKNLTTKRGYKGNIQYYPEHLHGNNFTFKWWFDIYNRVNIVILNKGVVVWKAAPDYPQNVLSYDRPKYFTRKNPA